MADNPTRTQTSTQIRNMYCDGVSYLNISFYNTNLSFRFYPFLGRDNVGKTTYDLKNGQNTTVNFEGAFALYQAAKDIIEGKSKESLLTIPCAAGATLTLERKAGQNGQMETILAINKNNQFIPFVFQTATQQVKDDHGKVETKVIETGVGVLLKTIEGYLTGINADRHLDKLTEEYAKLQQGQQGGYQNGGYRGQGQQPYKKTYQGGYKKPYQGGGQQNNWGRNQGAPQNRQNMSDYQLPN